MELDITRNNTIRHDKKKHYSRSLCAEKRKYFIAYDIKAQHLTQIYKTRFHMILQHTSPFIGVGEDRIKFRTSMAFTTAHEITEQNSKTHSVFTHADEHENRTIQCRNAQNCAKQKTATFFGVFG